MKFDPKSPEDVKSTLQVHGNTPKFIKKKPVAVTQNSTDEKKEANGPDIQE